MKRRTKFDRCYEAVSRSATAVSPGAICSRFRTRRNPDYDGVPMTAGELASAVEAGSIVESAPVILETVEQLPNPRRRRNPEGSAASMYERFHGRPSEHIVEIVEELREHSHLAVLGALLELKVMTPTDLDATISFTSEHPFLSSNEEGTQLYIRGGDQEVNLRDLKMDSGNWYKDFMNLGVCYEVTYQTQKRFHRFRLIDYYHALGEEGGDKPMLVYDTMNNLLSIVGGQYRIKPEGIVN